jgi:hypothetical protein
LTGAPKMVKYLTAVYFTVSEGAKLSENSAAVRAQLGSLGFLGKRNSTGWPHRISQGNPNAGGLKCCPTPEGAQHPGSQNVP